MPECSNFLSKPAWGTVSKAFEKSRMATSIWDLELKEDNKSLLTNSILQNYQQFGCGTTFMSGKG